jgi:hypothetical protein
MSVLKVEGHSDLIKDTKTKGVVNTDKNGYEVYMRKVIMRKTERETVRGLVREINELREELKDIKNLLGKENG